MPSALGLDGCFDQSNTFTSAVIDLVAIRYGFCGMYRARFTSPSWLMRCVISTFASLPPKPPASPRSSSYLRASTSASSFGSFTSPIIR